MRRTWVARWAIALVTTFAPPAAGPAEAGATGTAGWPVKPGARAPQLPPPRLAPARARRPAAARAATRNHLAAQRLARAIARAMAGPKPSAALQPPRPGRSARKGLRQVPRAGSRSQARPARKTRLRRGPRPHHLRRSRARAPQPPGLQPTEPRLPPPPAFLGDLYVQQGGATLYAAYARGQVVGRLPPATIVTNMGREGAWYRIEAPNGAVGYVKAGSVGATPPPW
ncbi:MAG: SH3 domain-containing protein [Candidatus Sericytochromatia bacterium]|nr:SH3 domain-containing protein [Candidatus Sericytochromatia bacterium]